MSVSNNIPFLDLVTPHLELKEELCEVFSKALETAGFIGGPMVQGFEQDFAKYCDASHCVGVNSGTDAPSHFRSSTLQLSSHDICEFVR